MLQALDVTQGNPWQMDAQHAAKSWMGQALCQTGGFQIILQYSGAVAASVQLSLG